MRKFFLLLAVVLILFCLSGCAGTVTSKLESPPNEKEVVKLECTSGYRHGCRHHGQVMSWEQWIGAKGYPTEKYEITRLETSGTLTRVEVSER